MENMSKKEIARIFFKHYLTAGFSILCVCLRYLTVLLPHSSDAFRLYVFGVVWLTLLCFIIVPIKIFKIASKSEINKHEIISTLLMAVCVIIPYIDGVSFNIV